MWKVVSAETQQVAIQLIDFEDAIRFGDAISQQFISNVITDRDFRYPVDHSCKGRQTASKLHNLFFLLAAEAFLQDECASFTDFMDSNGPEIFARASTVHSKL